VPPDSVPDSVATELVRLRPGRIVVVGGPLAVSDSVVAALGGYTSGGVTRVAGADRYATAAALSAMTFQPGVPTVFVASGQSFADALAAGPVAARDAAPILLTTANGVPPATEAELVRLRPQQVIVVGGSAVITPKSLTGQLGSPATTSVARVAGADRYETAIDLARLQASGPASTVFLVSGVEFADAEAAVPAAARALAPILLSRPDCLPPSVSAALQSPPPARLVVVGGTNAVSDAVGQLQVCPGQAATITAAPDAGLGDGDVVKVAGTGFPTGQPLIVIECDTDPAIAPNGSGCDVNDAQTATASPTGTVGPVVLTVRTGQVGSDPRATCPPSPAQSAAGITCKAVISTLDGSVAAAQTLTFRPTGPPATVSAVPTTGLVDGQTVTISGANFPAAQTLTVAECSGATAGGLSPPGPFVKPGIGIYGSGGPSACDGRTVVTVGSDAAGHFGPAQLIVHTGRFGDGSTACPPTREQQVAGVSTCDLVVSSATGRTVVTVPLTFTSVQTGPALPAVQVTPAVGLHDGDMVTLTATGFPAYTPVNIAECSLVPDGSGLLGYPGDCQGGAGYAPSITTDQNGAIGPVSVPVQVQSQQIYGPTPAPVLTACPPTPQQQQAGIAACVISVSVLDGAMTAAAPIAFAPGVTAPPVVEGPPPPIPVEISQLVDPGDMTPNSGEHVVLLNTDPTNPASVGNWSIEDLAGNRLLIGPGYTIPPGGSLSIYTGAGTDTASSYFNGITVPLLAQPVQELTLYTDGGQPVSTFTRVAPPPAA
jgi:putative cell wall-binding protein